jgi:PAP2 superfamily
MAWEKLALPRRGAIVSRVSLSLLLIAILIAAARFTNFDEPYLPFAIGGVLAFFLRASPSRWEIYAWLLSSALFIEAVHVSHIPFWVLRVATAFALLGFGAVLLLGLRAIWSEHEVRENALALLLPALILIVFISATAQVLRFSGSLNPYTDDAWLYAFDGSLGFQPSFAMARIMLHSIVLARSASLTYLSLPFAMAVVCAGQIRPAARRISWRMLIVLLLAGVSGWLFYNAVPGTGPVYAFGRDFPWNAIPYKDLSTFALEKMPMPAGIPRNAMPSLHMGWVVLLFWNSRGLSRALRAALLLYLALTVVATLGTGQHYLIDLIVSLPFVLAVQSAASPAIPDKTRRLTTAAAGLGLTLAWLAVVRFGLSLALISPWIPWTLVLLTVGATFWLEAWMWKRNSTAAVAESVSAMPTEAAPGLR